MFILLRVGTASMQRTIDLKRVMTEKGALSGHMAAKGI